MTDIANGVLLQLFCQDIRLAKVNTGSLVLYGQMAGFISTLLVSFFLHRKLTSHKQSRPFLKETKYSIDSGQNLRGQNICNETDKSVYRGMTLGARDSDSFFYKRSMFLQKCIRNQSYKAKSKNCPYFLYFTPLHKIMGSNLRLSTV